MPKFRKGTVLKRDYPSGVAIIREKIVDIVDGRYILMELRSDGSYASALPAKIQTELVDSEWLLVLGAVPSIS